MHNILGLLFVLLYICRVKLITKNNIAKGKAAKSRKIMRKIYPEGARKGAMTALIKSLEVGDVAVFPREKYTSAQTTGHNCGIMFGRRYRTQCSKKTGFQVELVRVE